MIINSKRAAEICREWYVAFSHMGKHKEKCVLELLDAADTIEALEAAQPKWISVEDRLPDVGEKVMVCGVKNGMQVGTFRGISRHGKSRKWWWKKNTILEVTHWMPLPSLPEPPKEDT